MSIFMRVGYPGNIMPAFKDLTELIETVIDWEDTLTGYYDRTLESTVHTGCRDLLNLLRARHLEHVAMLRDLDVTAFGPDEWVLCIPDTHPPELLEQAMSASDAAPREMVERIVTFEQQVQEFYRCIAGLVATRDERELFESLARTKDRNLFEIRSCLEYSGGAL